MIENTGLRIDTSSKFLGIADATRLGIIFFFFFLTTTALEDTLSVWNPFLL